MKRNPNKIFIGMVMDGSMRWETSLLWEQLRNAKIDGYEFSTNRLGGYGQAKARNALTWLALQTDCGRMFCLDADINATIQHALRILGHDEEMVSAMYPKKTAAALEFVGNFTGSPAREDGLAEALDCGGGFVAIDLSMVERMIAAYPETEYECEDAAFRGKIMHDLWSCGPVTDSWRGRTFSRYLTEDFYFCHRARKMGVTVWQDTQCQVGHVGTVDFLDLHLRLKELEKSSIFAAPGAGA